MLSFSSLLSDTKNFISNNLVPIIIALFSLAMITQWISFLFYPHIENYEPLKQLIEQTIRQYGEQLSPETLSQTVLALSEQEQQQLIPAAIDYLVRVGTLFVLLNLLSMSVILALIDTISHQRLSLSSLLSSMGRITPNIILFMLLAIPLFIALSLVVSIVPPLAIALMMIAAIFYLAGYIIFLVVIIEPALPARFIKKVKISLAFFKREIRLIIPIIAIWLVVTFILNNVTSLLVANSIMLIVIKVLKLLLTLITLCYLYRLFSLSNKLLPYDACH